MPGAESATFDSIKVVELSYEELVQGPTPDTHAKIKEAFGYEGHGIIAVTNVPKAAEYREKALPLAYKFANLPEEIKDKYVNEESLYNIGWSHGKEKLEGKPDYAKGSFYANPTYDVPMEDEEIVKKLPAMYGPNIFPSEEDCPGFKDAFKSLGQLIVETGIKLSKHIDSYVNSRNPTYSGPSADKDGQLENTIKFSRSTKGRLLFYFPASESDAIKDAAADANDFSSWCGWHNDHGSLTGLASAMYFDKDGNAIPCPDPSAGLYIKSRQGQVVRVVTPPNSIAFQIGETSQILSGGILQATPHCVKAAAVPGVSRATMAIFMEPDYDAIMDVPQGADPEEVFRGARGELLPKGVPTLAGRWTGPGTNQTFADFSERTFASFY